MKWAERYPSERGRMYSPAELLLPCPHCSSQYCGTVCRFANKDRGAQVDERRCPADDHICRDERCTDDNCAEVVRP